MNRPLVAAEVTRRSVAVTQRFPPPYVHPPQYCYGGRVGGYGSRSEGMAERPRRLSMNRLLSPSLSSTRSGGEGARRAGEEVPSFKVPMRECVS